MNAAALSIGQPLTNGEQTADFDEDWDFTTRGVYEAVTHYYAGPFCPCGDYSCAAMRDEHAPCSTAEGEHYVGSFYPEHWTDEDIDAYEFEFVIDAARYDNEDAAAIAAAQLGTPPYPRYAIPPRNGADDNHKN